MNNKTKEFLQKLKDSGHWNNDYDYSKVEYVKSKDKVIVIDKRCSTTHFLLFIRTLFKNFRIINYED